MADAIDRRGFFGVAGGALLLCTIDGKQVAVRTADDVEKVDAAMTSLRRPRSAAKRRPARDPLDSASFPSPQPQPGGQQREDNPGRWLYHCHVFTHQDAGMAGWYLVDP